MLFKETGLSKEDVISVVRLIDAMSQRGAIQGSELVAVGSLRVKYEQAADKLQKEENETDSQE